MLLVPVLLAMLAQENHKRRPLRVCTAEVQGFNMISSGASSSSSNRTWTDGVDLIGFDADMRKLILKDSMGLDYELVVKDSISEVLQSVTANNGHECDIGWVSKRMRENNPIIECDCLISNPFFLSLSRQ